MISGEVVKRPISVFGIRIHKAIIPAAIADRQCNLIYDKINLVYRRSAGKCILAITSQHDIVQHIHAVGHQVLQRDYCH